jgi:hypothetical protein
MSRQSQQISWRSYAIFQILLLLVLLTLRQKFFWDRLTLEDEESGTVGSHSPNTQHADSSTVWPHSPNTQHAESSTVRSHSPNTQHLSVCLLTFPLHQEALFFLVSIQTTSPVKQKLQFSVAGLRKDKTNELSIDTHTVLSIEWNVALRRIIS